MSIKFRKNPLSSTEVDVAFKGGEKVSHLVKRALAENNLQPEAYLESYQAVLNSQPVPRELWDMTVIYNTDDILIVPIVHKGESGALLKTAVLIAVAIVAPAAGPALGYGATASAFISAGITIGAALLLNSLYPPPGLPELGGFGPDRAEDSQMYNITGQANAVKKYGKVPKVYGSHRMFPNIAASPYVDLTTENGQVVQYFVAVYDFGFGPAFVEDIRIGNTPIGDFFDVQYNLVDLNKPAVSEGEWDDITKSSFQYYKQDVEFDPASVVLEKNQFDTPAQPLNTYQVIRDGSANVNGSKQELVIDLQFPQGLKAFDSVGGSSNRTVEVQIEFARVSDGIWREFDDLNYVDDYHVAGGKLTDFTFVNTIGLRGPFFNAYPQYIVFSRTRSSYSSSTSISLYFVYNLNPNINYLVLETGKAVVNDRIFFGSANPATFGANTHTLIGKVTSITPSIYGGYSIYYLDRNLPSVTVKNTNPFGSFSYESSHFQVYKENAGVVNITDNNQKPRFISIRFTPKIVDQYRVRITRLRSYSTATYQIYDQMVFGGLSTRFDRNPIVTDKRHMFLELRIKATNQLSGAIQNLSGTVSSVIPVYDEMTQTWVKQVSSNPAWIFADLMTGELNPRAIDKSRLHLPSLVEWAEFCDEVPLAPPPETFTGPRYTLSFVLDFNTTLAQLLNKVANSCQASMNVIDGKYGVLLDVRKTTPVQIFTPRNSWEFSVTKSYYDPVDAVRVKFISPDRNWELDEAVVYSDGKDINTAEKFEDVETFGCTNFSQAWRYGRFILASSILRREVMTLKVDFEYLVCTRGDYVRISQDVMKVGGRPARVRSISGNTVTLDDSLILPAGPYGYIFRRTSNGAITETATCTAISASEYELDGLLPSVGDLIIVGPVSQVYYECIVKSIQPDGAMTATLVLIEKADAIHDAESTTTLPVYDPQLVIGDEFTPPAVTDLALIANTWRVLFGAYQYYMTIDWEIVPGTTYEQFEIYVDFGEGYDLHNITKQTHYEYIVNEDNLDIPHFFKVLAVGPTGKKITLIEAPFVTGTPARKITPPSDVEALYINITNQVMQLEWPRISDADLKEYLIRYTPVTIGATWEASTILQRVDGITNSVSFQGRVGTYFIKAIDLNGNQSTGYAQALTTIPGLFDLNIIEETNDFPAMPGELIATEYLAGGLTLKKLNPGDPLSNEYYPEGYYYYENFLDLGEIYTVRLQSLINAEGFTVGDLMSNWITLDQVASLANAGSSSWDVETYYRNTDSFNVISEWPSLDVVDPISEGVQDNWEPWRKFVIGDATGRIFQFRLKLISYVAAVTPRVFDGIIRADMPDRTYSLNNQLSSNVSPTTINYLPAFKGPGTSPNIQITQDNAQSGDYYTITNRTLNGFDITFYDSTDTQVARQFDVFVKGYGYKSLVSI